ncbi:GNAT family N-acetyltransferase [Aminiphilus sp.]|jgi:RimJ/RimL family protein N-acetyltransferase|uniref:GNAT family N-acetyltransferase n=1 Tax=Aminiphilus sp. TaxID=1872488 RepID=UPI002610B2B6|nr:GNAT family N-acetyltransferase [Aminiphilus sp.]
MHFRKLVGDKCYLSPLSVEDAEQCTAWLNDLEVVRNLSRVSAVIGLEAEREALEKIGREHNYAIVDLATEAMIGVCGFFDTDHLNGTAELGIFIGDKAYWSRGYGREAMTLLLRYGFDYLNFENVLLRVYSFNARAIESYKRVGFREMGRRRRALKRERQFFDVIYMDITPEDLSGDA